MVILALWYLVAGILLPWTSNQPLDTLEERTCHHPVALLVSDATKAFNKTLQRQSKSLAEAVTEYQRRYKMPPPPYFDEWYHFATSRNTVLIDEFDTIYHTLLPFWGLTPSVMRSRVRDDLGRIDDTYVMGIAIRSGRVVDFGKGQGGFQREPTIKILKKFSQWLPDLNLQFNAHDEPRVVVAHEQLHRFVLEGYAAQSRLNAHSAVSSLFSPGDVDEPVPPVPVSTDGTTSSSKRHGFTRDFHAHQIHLLWRWMATRRTTQLLMRWILWVSYLTNPLPVTFATARHYDIASGSFFDDIVEPEPLRNA